MNSVLALMSYYEWKQGGGNGVWKFSGNSKPPCEGRQFVRKNSDLFLNSILRNSSAGEKLLDGLSSDLGECVDEMVCKLTTSDICNFSIARKGSPIKLFCTLICRAPPIPFAYLCANFFLIRTKKIFHWQVFTLAIVYSF